MAKKVFKHHQFGQIMLLPPSLDEMIDKNHPVRIVSQIIDQIDISPLEKQYKGGGTSSYHPRILLKILVYAYLDNVYSSRRIEACLKENIHYMWISGMSSPDHNTINRFRGERLKGVLKQIFGRVVELLVAEGLVNLKGRNSYSKTDPEATFMRMKDDHMRNGQLKPGYNLQISTQDQHDKGKKNPFSADKLYYNEETDCYYCPMGQPMVHNRNSTRITNDTFSQTYAYYQAQNCQGCPLRGICHKRDGNRIIEVNHQLRLLKVKARALLLSEEGIKRRKKRPYDVEPVFGNIKYNKGFKRFMLTGCDKVEIEAGLLSIAHNLKKWSC